MQCVQVLQRRRPRSSAYYLLGTAISLFILTTTVSKLHMRSLSSYGSQRYLKHLVGDTIRVMREFTSNMEKFHGNVDVWIDIMRNAIYATVTVISNAFIVSLALSV